jgi:hypothetical protein
MDDAPVAVYYDLDVRFLGQRYLLQARPDGPGFTTIPVTDQT